MIARQQARRLFIGGAVALFIASCSLAFDLDALSNGRCGDMEKGCDGRCVSKFSPRTGCAQPSCAPCNLDNATANCDSDGQCAVASCRGSYVNCDDDGSNGCEVDVDHDPLHCGSCKPSAPCTTEHGSPACSAHQCTIGACEPGYGDCNDRSDDGCETDLLTSAEHCSACDTPCGEEQRCASGVCVGETGEL